MDLGRRGNAGHGRRQLPDRRLGIAVLFRAVELSQRPGRPDKFFHRSGERGRPRQAAGREVTAVIRTLNAGTLIIRSAYPDPPFDVMRNGAATGFDIELMRAVCDRLGLMLRPVAYTGEDFNGIFAGLAQRTCDAVVSGTTITPARAAIVKFSQPYLVINQGVAVNRRLTPDVTSTADLRGLTA